MIKKISTKLLKLFCHPDFYPDIAGDLEELYQRNKTHGKNIADLRYALQVMGLFRPSLMRSFNIFSFFNSNGMIRNTFKISFRTLYNQKTYAIINIGGLAISLTAFLLIRAYVSFENSYDTQFTNASQIYRLSTHQVIDGEVKVKDAMSFNPSGKMLVDKIPEINQYTTTYRFDELIVRLDEKVYTEEKIVAADEHFLSIFDYQLLAQSSKEVLSQPNTIVLNQTMATKYFGQGNPIGERLYITGFSEPLQVVDVVEDIPLNTHFKFNALISLSTIQEILDREAWNAFNYYTYLTIQPGSQPEYINQKIAGLSKEYLNEGTNLQFNMHPIQWIHLHSDYTYETEQPGNATTIMLLSWISWFILVIAWVNYVNLATAKAINRAKEVGIKKVVGASRSQLILQFFIEAFMVNFIGAILAIGIGELVLPYFNALATMPILEHFYNDPNTLLLLLTFTLVGTLLSGFYPALVLSGFKPVTVLKGKFRDSSKGLLLRKTLVLLQFSTSMVLLASTLIVYQQVQHMRQMDLGYNIDQVLGFTFPNQDYASEEEEISRKLAFMQQLRQQVAIEDVASMDNLPGGGSSDVSSNAGKISIIGITEPNETTTYIQGVDDNAMDLLKFNFIHGRNFEKNLATDTAAIICNETFLRKLNVAISEDLINERIKFGTGENSNSFAIIGIVKDAHRSSVKNAVEPTVYFYSENPSRVVAKINSQQLHNGLNEIEQTWKAFFPQQPISYAFLDERFERLYQSDKRFGAVFGTFSALAILVAIFGLFGLSSYMAAQRTKEVGIRKVLGASLSQILVIFIYPFVILTVFAAIISGPIIYFGMGQWLENFASRIHFPWIMILVSMMVILLFAVITTGFQVLRVAMKNPVRALRYE